MPRVANFAQLRDESFSLVVGGDIDRALTQDLADAPAAGEGALLTWNVQREGTGTVTYEVTMNGTRLNTYTATLGERRAVQEAMDTTTIHQGTNTVVFRVLGGTGTLEIGDVILFYRQDV